MEIDTTFVCTVNMKHPLDGSLSPTITKSHIATGGYVSWSAFSFLVLEK